MKLNKEDLGLLALRLGIAGVFVWFGISKFIAPFSWVKWMPSWFLNSLPITQNAFIYIMGGFEVIVGIFILMGYFTKIAAALAALQLLGIIVSIGVNEITTRDLGLLFLAIGIGLLGPGALSIDRKKEIRKEYM